MKYKIVWRHRGLLTLLGAAMGLASLQHNSACAQPSAAERWVDKEFKPSTLTRAQQLAEMRWFADAAGRLRARGITSVQVVSEKIDTHDYESQTLSKAFAEITGLNVRHDVITEGDLVDKLYAAIKGGKSEYDGWISDSDLIGTHYRYGAVVPLSDFIQGVGKEFTIPTLDLTDFIGTQFTTAPDGKKVYGHMNYGNRDPSLGWRFTDA